MESPPNYTPLNSSPDVKQAFSSSLKYFFVIGAAFVGLAIIITSAIFLNQRIQQQSELTANQVEPTLTVAVTLPKKQPSPTKQVNSSSSFTATDAERLEKALSSQDEDEYSSVYQEAIREITRGEGAPFPPGTTIDISPSTFTRTGTGLGTVVLSASGTTNKKDTLYLIREKNEWFIYAAEEQK